MLLTSFGKYHDATTSVLMYVLCVLLATCRKAALKDSLQRAIMNVFGVNTNTFKQCCFIWQMKVGRRTGELHYISFSEIHTRHLSPVIGGCIITDIVVDHAIIGQQSDVGKLWLMSMSSFIRTKHNILSVTAKVNYG